ncbi:MAG: MSMEG_0565 family glycosyltransferase [Frankia sp.]
MRIALLTYSTRPRGGVVATLALAEALARAGASVDLWTLARGGDTGFFRPVDPAVGVHAVPFQDREGESLGPRVLRSIAALREAFDRARANQGYDIVHAQDCISANSAAPCLRTVHHLDNFTTPELATCHEKALREPLAHLCVSAAVAAELRAGWGITATVIPNGVDADRFRAAAGPEEAAAGRRDAWRVCLGRYVLAVGGIEPRKGTLDLVEAFALLQRDWLPPAGAADPRPPRLVVAGGETLFDYRDYRDAVDRRAAELDVHIEVLGSIGHEDMPPLVAAAAAFAFPSTREGFGLAAMEALAAGVPVVASDLPVLREVFTGAVRFAAGPAALAAGLADALRRDDPDLRTAGRALAARHSWDTAAAAHLAFYRSRLST